MYEIINNPDGTWKEIIIGPLDIGRIINVHDITAEAIVSLLSFPSPNNSQ